MIRFEVMAHAYNAMFRENNETKREASEPGLEICQFHSSYLKIVSRVSNESMVSEKSASKLTPV